MGFDNNESLDISGVDLKDDADTELKELSQEEEAMKVLTRIAREHGLSSEDDLIRQIYQEAVAARDNDQSDADAPTVGRRLYEQIAAQISGKGEDE
jgi:hypothetical protein